MRPFRSARRRAARRADVPALVLAALLAGCSSPPAEAPPPAEVADPPRFRVGTEEPGAAMNFGRETDPVQLFVQLDRQLRNARDPASNVLVVRNIAPVLARYVDANVDLILAALDGDNERHRLVAAWALGYAGDPQVTRRLLGLLADPSPKVRANALHALSLRRDPATPLAPLLAGFADDDAGVRCNAARAVREVLAPGTGTEAIVPLTGLVRDEDPMVRLAAVGALGRIARPECLGYLVGALSDKTPLVRTQAALALGKSSDPAAVSHLLAALRSETNPLALDALVKALEILTGQQLRSRDEWLEWGKRARSR
ncbi:MAG: HEAT repeat domain-containing protein [Planctomycetes bacterium]|nr:HEAT repeat domain-containing protein [Planctomycetota bacterium]